MSGANLLPDALTLTYNGLALELETYGNDGDGVYLKARRPDGGTVEVHILRASYFEDHPDACGVCGKTGPAHEPHA